MYHIVWLSAEIQLSPGSMASKSTGQKIYLISTYHTGTHPTMLMLSLACPSLLNDQVTAEFTQETFLLATGNLRFLGSLGASLNCSRLYPFTTLLTRQDPAHGKIIPHTVLPGT